MNKRPSLNILEHEQLKKEKLEPLQLRRSTHKICKKCNVSAEYYEDTHCSICASKFKSV